MNSVSFAPAKDMPFPRPATCFFIFARNVWTFCFELETQILERIRASVELVDEVQSFRYFDDRDLIGFVDGTENPRGEEAVDAVLVRDEDPVFANGSYVIVQKYLHDMAAWNALPVEAQERIIGRKKLSDIELEDSVKPSCAHNALTVIEENGQEKKILRDNMPFGRPALGEFGTYFIGHSPYTSNHRTDVGKHVYWPSSGRYPDRLLDFSRPVTGTLFLYRLRHFWMA